MSAEKLTRDSKFSEYVVLLQTKLACTSAVDLYSNYKDVETITIGKALDEFIADDLIGQDWAAWTLKVLGDDLADDVRNGFIEKIKDPMIAFQVYLKMPNLSENEDQLLEAKFKGKLPKAEKELIDGVVKRAKDG